MRIGELSGRVRRLFGRSLRYRVASRWRVEATSAELCSVIRHPERLAEWWPAAFLSSERLREPGTDGAGGYYCVYTKGWAPYTMRFDAWVTRVGDQEVLIETAGDFEGGASLRCRAADDQSTESPGSASASAPGCGRRRWLIDLEWQVRVNKPLLIVLSPLLKPLLVANHRWVVAQGETGLRRALVRWRAAARGDDPATLPQPPGPTWPHSMRWVRRFARRARATCHQEALS